MKNKEEKEKTKTESGFLNSISGYNDDQTNIYYIYGFSSGRQWLPEFLRVKRRIKEERTQQE